MVTDKEKLASVLEKVSGLLDSLYEYVEDDEERDYINEVENELQETLSNLWTNLVKDI